MSEDVLSEEQLREIEERERKASPGPWILGHSNTEVFTDAIDWMTNIIIKSTDPDLWCTGLYRGDDPGGDDPETEFLFTAVTGNGPTSAANADFIAHARQDIPALVATIRELQARVETTTWYNGTLLTELSTLREQLAELEGQVNPPCPDPSIDAFYLEGDKGET